MQVSCVEDLVVFNYNFGGTRNKIMVVIITTKQPHCSETRPVSLDPFPLERVELQGGTAPARAETGVVEMELLSSTH